MKIENMILNKDGEVKPSEQLSQIIINEAKKIKLSLPFEADGFKSSKQPFQPDGVTPMEVNKANISENSNVEKSKEKPKEIKKVYTEEELKEMSKKEQVDLLKTYGVTKIPPLEKDRITKLLELQN